MVLILTERKGKEFYGTKMKEREKLIMQAVEQNLQNNAYRMVKIDRVWYSLHSIHYYYAVIF